MRNQHFVRFWLRCPLFFRPDAEALRDAGIEPVPASTAAGRRRTAGLMQASSIGPDAVTAADLSVEAAAKIITRRPRGCRSIGRDTAVATRLVPDRMLDGLFATDCVANF